MKMKNVEKQKDILANLVNSKNKLLSKITKNELLLKELNSLNRELEKVKLVTYGKKEILDKAEKQYLGSVIRPFRNRVWCLYKSYSGVSKDYHIVIELDGDCIELPDFSMNSEMYRGMETNKEYTLEELGL